MKKILILLSVVFLAACHNTPVGYLKTDNVRYRPDSLVVRTVLDENGVDAVRVNNNAPWVTGKIVGVLGTPPINYSVADVKASEGGDAVTFRNELEIRGAGVMMVPLRPESPKGRYLISVRVHNEGYSAVIEDAFTFIIE